MTEKERDEALSFWNGDVQFVTSIEMRVGKPLPWWKGKYYDIKYFLWDLFERWGWIKEYEENDD